MNTHIRNADARRFWESVYLACFVSVTQIDGNGLIKEADLALDDWAARFADEETLADIDANKARREMGNEP